MDSESDLKIKVSATAIPLVRVFELKRLAGYLTIPFKQVLENLSRFIAESVKRSQQLQLELLGIFLL